MSVISPDTYIDFKTADDFIGSTLQAVKPVSVYSNAAGTGRLIETVPAGKSVGEIYSWVKGADGSVWWSIDRNGSHFGFAKHEYDAFNGEKAKQTSDLYKSEVKKQLDQMVNTSDFLSFLDDMPLIGSLSFDRVTKLILLLAGIFIGLKVLKFFRK